MQYEAGITSFPSDAEARTRRRNFAAGLWHGTFLALGVSLTQPTTVISAFVVDLTGSTVWVGGLIALLSVAGALPQLFAARWIEPRPRKMPYLMTAIYLRILSWGTLAWLIFAIGDQYPMSLAWILVGMLIIFYAGGGLGNIPYTDIIGKIVPPNRRGAFFGGIGALAGPLSVGAALAARHILAHVNYPNSYALLFGFAAIALTIASLGFWVMREPSTSSAVRDTPPWHEYWKQLKAASRRMKEFITTQLLTGFSLMALPFYVVFAREILDAPLEAVGWFLLAQVIGGLLSNLVWARLVDKSGSRRMIFYCAVLSFTIPLLAIALSHRGWLALLPVFFLAGAIINGRSVGFQSALLELAPVSERSTYAALNSVLIIPIAFLSLMGGLFLLEFSYTTFFIITAVFIAAGAFVAWRWAAQVQDGCEPES
jgi:MFS family permease